MENPKLPRLATCFTSILILISFNLFSQVLTPRYTSMTTNTKGFYEYLPQGYSPSASQTYPVLIMIHGIGELGQGNSGTLKKLLNNGPVQLINQGKFPTSFTVNGKSFKFIVIAPQFVAWPQPADINTIIDYVLKNYKADASRIYLTGLSMGGGATWEYAGSQTHTEYPKRLAALAPVCGAAYPNTYKSKGIANANLPVWAFHNQNDPTVPSWYTNDFIKYISEIVPKINPLPRKTIFPVSGHNAWSKAYDPTYREDGKNVYEWMLSYTRGGAPAANAAPVVNAGADKTITLPVNTMSLSATASDPDGKIVSTKWEKTSGPAFGISNLGILSPILSALLTGSYQFKVTVTDDKGATASDVITITVKAPVVTAPAANKAPVVNAGTDATISLPTNSYQVSATASDADGKISKYAWQKTAGPSSFKLSSTSVINPKITGLVAGTYTFRLTVTDDDGATASNDVVIKVNAANKPPAVDAGKDAMLTLPANTYQINAIASDADGKIAKYKWALEYGPTTYTLSSTTVGNPKITVTNRGTYRIRLTVTDDDGATASDLFILRVGAAAPVVATKKAIRVNIFGGSNPYTNAEWNNWNVGSTSSRVSTAALKYSDGSASAITAALDYSEAITDNSTSYPGGVAPKEVLRYTSYATVNRTLTISGLTSGRSYDLELYSSRNNTGNKTLFSANGKSYTVNSSKNSTEKASFTALTANAQGKIEVSIARVNTFNYVNGFTLTENNTASAARSSTIDPEKSALVQETAIAPVVVDQGLAIFPNPATDRVTVRLNNAERGRMNILLFDLSGRAIRQYSLQKDQDLVQYPVATGDLTPGQYILRIQVGKWTGSQKVTRL